MRRVDPINNSIQIPRYWLRYVAKGAIDPPNFLHKMCMCFYNGIKKFAASNTNQSNSTTMNNFATCGHRQSLLVHLQRPIVLVYAQYKLQPWLPPCQLILFGAQQLWGASVIDQAHSLAKVPQWASVCSWQYFQRATVSKELLPNWRDVTFVEGGKFDVTEGRHNNQQWSNDRINKSKKQTNKQMNGTTEQTQAIEQTNKRIKQTNKWMDDQMTG